MQRRRFLGGRMNFNFEYYQDKRKRWRWRLKDQHTGKITAIGADSFKTEKEVTDTILAILHQFRMNGQFMDINKVRQN